jgi:hypothetical protein
MKKSETAFLVTSLLSRNDKIFDVSNENLPIVEGKVKFRRLRGIEGVPWMERTTYDGLVELLEGYFELSSLSSFTKDVKSSCFWKEPFFLFVLIPADD